MERVIYFFEALATLFFQLLAVPLHGGRLARVRLLHRRLEVEARLKIRQEVDLLRLCSQELKNAETVLASGLEDLSTPTAKQVLIRAFGRQVSQIEARFNSIGVPSVPTDSRWAAPEADQAGTQVPEADQGPTRVDS